ncbi:zf-CCHC domain-containing protein [Cucumis melo var. makuwa]|uniref:Zf-CCHC domain-containing protein n=2 Tax=Cucumis melo TaxID=3656 RepID=A0A5A7UGQ4_CUCMM|nr:zf-CCHC domain-containing protein [Cucumis melo var. makuwa]
MKLAKYTMSFIMDEEKCKLFKVDLRTVIRMPVTTSMVWLDFSKLVEAAMRVESALAEEKKSSK